MSHTRHGLKTLGLCLVAALSLVALTAADAQAKGQWMVSNANVNAPGEVTGELDSAEATLLSFVGATNTPMAVLCTHLEIDNASLSNEGKSLGELKFSTCRTLLNNVESMVCLPFEPLVAKVKGLLVKRGGHTYDLFTPDEGTTFATLHFDKDGTEECTLPEELSITGSIVAQCLFNNGGSVESGCEHELETQLIEQAPVSLFPSDVIKFGEKTMSLVGSVNLHLLAPHLGETWSGLGETEG